MNDNFYPIGAVLPYAGPISPQSEGLLISQGFIPCDGRGLSKSDSAYQALQTALGGAYGANDTVFFLPDYRGQFLRGIDGGAGRDPDAASRAAPRPDLPEGQQGNTGDAVGSVQAGAIRSHSHSYAMHSGDHTCNYGSLIGPGVYEQGKTSSGASSMSGGSETRPVNAYVNYVIRFK